jgi:hypothetical protein
VDNLGDRSQIDNETDLPEGLGRRRLARELDISEHAARRLLAERNGAAR